MSAEPHKERKGELLATVLQKKLKEINMNPRRLSAEIGLAYDSVRKVCKGEAFPGPKMLKPLCAYLKLDYDEMRQLVKIDKSIDSGVIELLTDEDPTLTRIKNLWVHLNKVDRQEIFEFVRLKVDRRTKG